MAPLTVTAPVLGALHTGGAAVSYRADTVLPTLLLGGMPPAAAASDLHAAGYAGNARRGDNVCAPRSSANTASSCAFYFAATL